MIIKIKPTPDPQEEGKFFFFSPILGLQIVSVYFEPSRREHCVDWGGYYFVSEWGQKDVSRHSRDSFFCGKVEVEFD